MNFKGHYNYEKNCWWHKSRRNIVSHLFWQGAARSLEKPQILSVGVSSGVEVEYLSQFGDVTGLEFSKDLVEYNTKRGLNVVYGDINECPLSDNSFDVVFAMDIIEHVKDHERAFEQVVRVTKPGGHMVITVPACQFLWSDHDVHGQGEFPHQRRYSKKSLKKLLGTQNVTIQKMSYYNFFLFPLVFAMRKLGVSSAAQTKVPGKFVNNVLYSIFSSEKRFLRWMRFPIGVSLIAICQKNPPVQ